MAENKTGLSQAFDFLVNLSIEQGYLLFDDIFPCSDKYNLDIQDIDRLTSKILDNGIILYENKPASKKTDSESQKDEFEDFSHSDYEPVYSKIVELDSSQKFFVDYVRKIVPPQRREMQQLQYQMLEGNQFARKRVIEMHIRLALKLALQYSERYENEISEMISLACEGLCKAADSFKPDENGSFSGYASYWIMNVFMRNMETKRPLVYYPSQNLNAYFKLYKYLDYLNIENDGAIVDDFNINKIAKFLNISETAAKELAFAFVPFESLNELLEYGDVDMTDKICTDMLAKDFEEIFQLLRPKERCVLKLRFGMYNKNDFDFKKIQDIVTKKVWHGDGIYNYSIPLTLDEIARIFNVTRERIRQIESKALKKIKESVLWTAGLREYLE